MAIGKREAPYFGTSTTPDGTLRWRRVSKKFLQIVQERLGIRGHEQLFPTQEPQLRAKGVECDNDSTSSVGFGGSHGGTPDDYNIAFTGQVREPVFVVRVADIRFPMDGADDLKISIIGTRSVVAIL